VVIGPEGGFAEGELARAVDRVDLGPHVLRAETAAIVAATRMVAHWRR
jgi:16S rRNA (uracil1498-N3)-methyltransferase